MFPGTLWRFSWTLHLNRYCKHSPISQYFFSADDKNELDEELGCSFRKSAIIEGNPNSKIAFSWQRGCLTLTASEVAFFYPPWSHMQEKQAPHFRNLPFPQFSPHFKPITADYKSVMFTFAIKFEQIRFDVWINCWTQLFGSTQTGIRFGTCKVRRLNCALLSLLKTNDNWIYLGPL